MKTLYYTLLLVTTSLFSTGIYAQKSPFGDRYWTVTSITINPPLDVNLDGKPDTDLRILVPACEKDDAERYSDDVYIIIHRGTTLCDEEEERTEEFGTWSYDKKTKQLTVEKYDSEQVIEATVESASDSEIVFVSKHQSSYGSHTIRTRFKPKKV
jgi:hypothetical protein